LLINEGNKFYLKNQFFCTKSEKIINHKGKEGKEGDPASSAGWRGQNAGWRGSSHPFALSFHPKTLFINK